MPIDCLLIVLDEHMFSPNGYGAGTRAKGPKAAVPQVLGPAAFGPWDRVPGPYPLWLNMCASGAINEQSIGSQYAIYTGNLAYYMSYL